MNGVAKMPFIEDVIRVKIAVLKDFEVITMQVQEDYIRIQLEKIAKGKTYDNALRALDIYTNDLILGRLKVEVEADEDLM